MASVLFRCWTPSAARPPLPYQHQLQVRETKLILAKMIYRVSRNTGPIRGDNFCEPRNTRKGMKKEVSQKV